MLNLARSLLNFSEAACIYDTVPTVLRWSHWDWRQDSHLLQCNHSVWGSTYDVGVTYQEFLGQIMVLVCHISVKRITDLWGENWHVGIDLHVSCRLYTTESHWVSSLWVHQGKVVCYLLWFPLWTLCMGECFYVYLKFLKLFLTMRPDNEVIINIPAPLIRFLWSCTWYQLLKMLHIEIFHKWSNGRFYGDIIHMSLYMKLW
jgi:hypothetical protein